MFLSKFTHHLPATLYNTLLQTPASRNTCETSAGPATSANNCVGQSSIGPTGPSKLQIRTTAAVSVVPIKNDIRQNTSADPAPVQKSFPRKISSGNSSTS